MSNPNPPLPTYDQFQQYYCLNAAANAVGKMKATEATLQNSMYTVLTNSLPKLTGGWQLSFGPRVYKKQDGPNTGPDNAWYAAVSDSQKICVVAVAGTSLNSPQGWVNIDFGVNQVVDFAAWTDNWYAKGVTAPSPITSPPATGTAYAALGTCVGAFNVLSNPSNQYVAKGQLLGDYLANTVVPTGYKIIFTGHSMGEYPPFTFRFFKACLLIYGANIQISEHKRFCQILFSNIDTAASFCLWNSANAQSIRPGGAVSPVVGLGLVQAGMIQQSSTYILPSAGPSPGNADLFQDQKGNPVFPPGTPSSQPYAVYNTDLYNTLDVVPQAWSTDPKSNRNMANVLSIYAGHLGPILENCVEGLVKRFTNLANQSGIVYEPLPGTSLTGPPIPSMITDLNTLVSTIGTEHMASYWGFIGVQAWVDWVMSQLAKQPGVKELALEEVADDDLVVPEV